ncbi:hypothetical protein BV898_01877 [Hypsibius exemplaris]|uniref:Uncharacterized protein n=1 Tax=Hypsibius exemplaris TaxID=2072580 RepID=A0A1W0X9X5_HYPEX|nr:hypothetical protein BV898_01877 [Hypsibius exemplaris]
MASREITANAKDAPGLPQRNGSPNPEILSYPDSEGMKELTDMTLAELLTHLDPSLELATQEFQAGTSEVHWTERRLAARACYEIVYGIFTEKIPLALVSELLEVLAYFLESTFASQDYERIASSRELFRSFLSILQSLLVDHASGLWVAKILSIYYLKEGVVPDATVRDILIKLDTTTKCVATKPLHNALLALLHSLQPLRPDLISKSLFKRSVGAFPEFQPKYQERLPQRPVQYHRFESLVEPKTYEQWERMPWAIGKRDKWMTVDALPDTQSFVEFWDSVRWPDSSSALLADPKLLHSLWLSPRPSRTAVLLERKILNSLNYMFHRCELPESGRTAGVEAGDGYTDKLFELAEHISDHLHETLPSVATAAIELLNCPTTPIDSFVKAVENLSIIYLAGNGIDRLEQALHRLMFRFQSESPAHQLRILAALRKLLAGFFRDLPRLWHLQMLETEEKTMESAKTLFVVEETAIQACYVDTKETLELLLEFLDAMLWEPLLEKPCPEEYSLLMWSEAVNIWALLQSLEQYEPNGINLPVLLPHPHFFQCGLLHASILVSHPIRALAQRFLDVQTVSDENAKTMAVLRNIIEEDEQVLSYENKAAA